MRLALHNKTLIILGGDAREVELYRLWKEDGLPVKMAGFERCSLVDQGDRASEADFRRAAALIAPLSGIKPGGTVAAGFAAGTLALGGILAAPAEEYLLLAGSIAAEVRAALPGQARLVLTAEDDELALLNAVPTAEGAIQKAMELSNITLHGSGALVIGLGRCGGVLARALQGLGARVTAAVRRRETAALASTMLMEAVFMEELPEKVAQADFIFNTAPAPVLGAALLERVGKETLILDLAASPGGTDFDAARALGLKAYLLPALPGRVAPRTAGAILAKVYRRIMAERLKLTKNGMEGEDC